MQEDCTERPLRPPKYHACRDSGQIYANALTNATAKGQPLMVIFGFDSCPGCKAMHKQVFDPKHPTTHADIVKYLSKPALNAYILSEQSLKISVVRIHAKSEHGRALAKSLGILKDGGRLRSPLLLYVNSQTGQHYVAPPTLAPYCDWGADFAAGLEEIGVVQTGQPYVARKRCG